MKERALDKEKGYVHIWTCQVQKGAISTTND